MLSALRRGFAFVRRRPVIIGGYAMDLSAMIFGLPRAVFPVLAATTFNTNAQGLGYLYAAPGAGAVLAAALLAIRGARGWIGGFGVAPEYRRRGYASALIDDIIGSARERDLKTLTLEVLCDNVPAVALYRNAGFQVTRRLLSFETLTEDALMPDGFGYVSARELIDEADAVRPCWQREPASLRNGAGSSGVSDGNGTYALFRYNDSLAQVLKAQAQHARKFAALAVALSAGRQFRSVMLLNEPEESPLVGFAQEAGWNEPFLQYEMQMHL